MSGTNSPSTKRSPRMSAWMAGALALALLLALEALVRDTLTAIQLWVMTVISILLLLIARRRISRPHNRGEAPVMPRPSASVTDEHPRPDDPGPRAAEVPLGRRWRDFPVIITVEEAADLLRVDQGVVVEAIRAGELPGNQIAGHWRVRTKALLVWVDGLYRRRPDQGTDRLPSR